VDKKHCLVYNREMEKKELECPQCGEKGKQKLNGKNRSGTQSCYCGACKKSYTINPKRIAYCEEVRQLVIKEHFAGASGRAIGKLHGMSKSNVYNWIKKTKRSVDK
jgi:transposase-like protein